MRRFSKARDGRRSAVAGASDLAAVNRRFAPGIVAQLAFTSAAGGTYLLRDQGGANRYISIRTTAAVHIVFGNADVGAPTNADPLFEASDGWQDMIIPQDVTCLRLKGDSGSGSLTLMVGGPGSDIYGFLPLGSKVVLDLNADKGVVQTAGTIVQWNDQSSYGNHVTQATPANQPTQVKGAIDGHAGIVFAGNQWLSRFPTFTGLGVGSLPRIYCVLAYDHAFGAAVSGEPVSLVQDTTTTYRARMNTSGGNTHTYTTRNPAAADGVGQYFLNAGYGGVFALFDGNDTGGFTFMTVNRVNGTTSTASAGPLNGTLTRLFVGAAFNATVPILGKIARLVIVDNPTAAENTYIYSRFKLEYPSLPI